MYRFFLLFNFLVFNSFSQNIESVEIPAMKNSDMFPLGDIDNYTYFYATELNKDNIKLTLYKLKKENLELIESKEFLIKDFDSNIFNNGKGTCKVEALYKNNKFYFFYSLLLGQDYHIYLKTLDEHFSNEKTIKLGSIIETGYELLGNFFISYSPDYKNVLVVLKNFCEFKKAVGRNIEIYENTELINYDLINDKVVFIKKIPVEIEGMRLKSEQYKIDNDGNIIFLAAIAEKKKEERQRISINSLAIYYVEKRTEQLTPIKIDLTGIGSMNSKLLQLKNGDLFYLLASREVVKAKYISFSTPTKNYEKKIANFSEYKRDLLIDDIYETASGFQIAFSGGHRLNDLVEYMGIAQISKNGDLVWSKSLEVVAPLYFNENGTFEQSTAFYNNKLHVYYFENKPYALTDKIKKSIENKVKDGVSDYKKFNTVETIVDENGRLEKNIINENETYVLHPDIPKNLRNESASYFTMFYKKNFKIKKIALK